MECLYSPVENQLLAEADSQLKALIQEQYKARIRCLNTQYSAIAADFIGPIYIAYVLFVLKEAQIRGMSRLYFLSRDGYILFKIAKIFQPKFFPIDIRYLHISRRALKKPFAYIENRNTSTQEDYNMMVEFLRQEGLFDDQKIGLVDIGWKGTTRMMINAIIKCNEGRPTEFFYLATQDGVLPTTYGEWHSYLQPTELSSELTFIFENYFSAAPEKSTIGYERQEGKVVPVYDESQIIYEDIVNTNLQTVTYMATDIVNKACLWNNLCLLRIWTLKTIKVLSSLDVSIDLSPLLDIQNVDGLVFVKRMSFLDIIQYVFLGKRNSMYAQASLKLSCNNRTYHYLYQLRSYLVACKKTFMHNR